MKFVYLSIKIEKRKRLFKILNVFVLLNMTNGTSEYVLHLEQGLAHIVAVKSIYSPWYVVTNIRLYSQLFTLFFIVFYFYYHYIVRIYRIKKKIIYNRYVTKNSV